MRAAAAAWLVASGAALALDTTQWPPPEGVQARMRELQLVIMDRDSTPAQREAAREALGDLLKSPAGQDRGRTAGEKPPRPPRAAIDPFPSVVKPLPRENEPGVATLRVTEPSKIPEPARPAIDPRTGVALPPSARTAVDPLTGHVLHEVPGGYVDPTTGRFVPR